MNTGRWVAVAAAPALLALAAAAYVAARGRTLVINADIFGTVHLREGKRAIIAGCRLSAPPGKTAVHAHAGAKDALLAYNRIMAGSA